MGFSYSKPSQTADESAFFRLPAVVHREVFSYLNPRELFKLSRVSTSWKAFIISKNISMESVVVHIGDTCLFIRTEFISPLRGQAPVIYTWSFYGMWQKPFFKNRSINYNHYNHQMDSYTYHREPEKAFLFALNNFLELFNTRKGSIDQLTIHTDRIHMFGAVTRMSSVFENIEHVTVITKPDCLIDLAGFLIEKLRTMKVKQLTIQTKENIREFQNPSASDALQLDPILFHPSSSESELNSFILNWLDSDEKTLKSYWTHMQREMDKEVILNGLRTDFWDRSNKICLPSQTYRNATGWNTVVVTRDDGRRALITVTERIIGIANFSLAVINK